MRKGHSINKDALRINKRDASGTDEAAVVTVAADANAYWAVRRIDYSWAVAAAAVDTLTLAFGGTTVWEVEIAAASGPDYIDFKDNPINNAMAANEALTVTMSAGGGSSTSKVNVVYS